MINAGGYIPKAVKLIPERRRRRLCAACLCTEEINKQIIYIPWLSIIILIKIPPSIQFCKIV